MSTIILAKFAKLYIKFTYKYGVTIDKYIIQIINESNCVKYVNKGIAHTKYLLLEI